MNKSEIIDTFNTHFIEFVMDVERVFPNDTDITSNRKLIKKFITIFPNKLIKMFNEHFVLLYGNEIEKEDLTFFLENDYRKIHGINPNEKNQILEKIEALRDPVKNMSDNDKKTVIKYLKNLKKLTDLYYK